MTVSSRLVNADLKRLRQGSEMKSRCLTPTGEPSGVREEDGRAEQLYVEIEIRCDPRKFRMR